MRTYSQEYRRGQWKATCDRCGFDYHSGELRLEWTGLRVCGECFDTRHPQDYLQGKPDRQAPEWTRPAPKITNPANNLLPVTAILDDEYTESNNSGTLTDLSGNYVGYSGCEIASGGALVSGIKGSGAAVVTLTAGTAYRLVYRYAAGTSGNVLAFIRDDTNGKNSTAFGSIGSVSVNSEAAGRLTVMSESLLYDGLTYELGMVFIPALTGSYNPKLSPYSTTVGETVIGVSWSIAPETTADDL